MLLACLTSVYEQQLSAVDVPLGEGEDAPGWGGPQGQVSVAGGRDLELQPLWACVLVLCTQLLLRHLRHGAHPHLVGGGGGEEGKREPKEHR